MLHALVRRLPPGTIRYFGRVQFRHPWLAKIIRRVASRIASNEGTIVHGVGKGLRFDATGGYPGYLLGTTEPDEQRALASYLKPGAVFYDLGANIGFYSTLAAHIVGTSGAVYAFEPFPESAARTRHNARLNSFGHVRVFEAAVSDRDGVARFALMHGSASHRIGGEPDGPSIEVPTVMLDRFIAENELRPPSIVMIDVEGAEFAAITGMSKTLAEHGPVVMVEVHWMVDELRECFDRVLAPLGYSVRMLDGGPLPTEKTRYHVVFERLMAPRRLNRTHA